MTEKTDLTENREFSGGHHREITLVNIETLLNRNITPEEYVTVQAYESIFGRNYHYTEVIDVFRRSDEEWRLEMRTHCQRCGKYFRIPWKTKGDLCPECDRILEMDGEKSPWKPRWSSINNNDRARDILRLR